MSGPYILKQSSAEFFFQSYNDKISLLAAKKISNYLKIFFGHFENFNLILASVAYRFVERNFFHVF